MVLMQTPVDWNGIKARGNIFITSSNTFDNFYKMGDPQTAPKAKAEEKERRGICTWGFTYYYLNLGPFPSLFPYF